MSQTDAVPALRRPTFHHAPHGAWMNDPVGLIRWEGLWRLFYQRAEDPAHSELCWGQAVSENLLDWRDVGVALRPGCSGVVYSGSSVAVDGKVRAFFTRHDPAGPLQRQEAATACGDLRTWTLDPANPLIDETKRDSRDPFVFRWGNGWRMLLAEPVSWQDPLVGRSRLALHASADLRSWRPLGTLGPAPAPGVMYECPALIRLGFEGAEIWLLMVGVIDRNNDGARCGTVGWLGHFDGEAFVPSGPMQTIDAGPDFYAAAPWANLPDGEDPVVTAWVNSWAYARKLDGADWSGGAHALPRRLGVRSGPDGLRVVQSPAALPAAAHGARTLLDGDHAPLPASAMIRLHALEGLTAFGLRLDLGSGEQVMLTLSDGVLALRRAGPAAEAVGAGFAGDWAMPVAPDAADILVVIDGCVLEVFETVGGATMSALLLRPGRGELRFDAPEGGVGEVSPC